ncbi:MAG: carboxypeptidase regulatory-like domain-containing protein [Clostridia bacterium]|nr:carboxypeptidase regulatory-like domain-containing protein [Clostridia bacterium]
MKKSISLALTALMALSFVGCGGDEHTHTYSDAWSHNATKHWHAATCGDDLIKDEGDHTGGTATCTEQAECEVCGAPYGELLSHELDELGDCTVCGADVSDPDVSTVAKALEFGVSRGDKVTSGKMERYLNYFGTESTNYVYYELNPNYAYILEYAYDDYGNTLNEKWFATYGEDKILGLQNEGYGVSKYNYDMSVEMVNGYAFETLLDYDNTYYGVEEFVTALYGLSETKEEIMEDGYYAFQLTSTNDSNWKNEIAVAFALNDNYIMSEVYISIDTYMPEGYEEETNVPIYAEDPDRSYAFAIEQISGESFKQAYVPEELFAASYKLTNADGEEVSEIAATVGTAEILNLADVPEDADLTLDTFKAVVVDADGIETADVNVYVSAYSKEVYVTANAAGEYTVTLESAFVTKTIKVTATLPATTEIYAYANYGQASTAQIYADADFSFEVRANEYADASATVAITNKPETSTAATLTDVEGTYKFTPDVAGEYVITITSTVAADVSSTLTITVLETPDIATILNGQFMNANNSEEDNLMVMIMWDAKIIVVQYIASVWDWDAYDYVDVNEAETLSFTYDENTKEIALTHQAAPEGSDVASVEGVLNSLKINADYTISVVYNHNNGISKLVPYVEPTVYDEVAGEYRKNEYDDNYNLEGRWFLGLNADGTGAFYYQIFDRTTYSWLTSENIIEFTYTCSDDYAIEITVTSGAIDGFNVDTVNSSIYLGEVEGEYGAATGISFTFDGGTIVLEKN